MRERASIAAEYVSMAIAAPFAAVATVAGCLAMGILLVGHTARRRGTQRETPSRAPVPPAGKPTPLRVVYVDYRLRKSTNALDWN
jgi:hypothetical protein